MGTKAPPMDDGPRFGRLWSRWDARLAKGESPQDILRDAKDEDLVEILAGESKADRKYARDVIATELLNRLRARSRRQPAAAAAAEESARSAHKAAQEGQEAIHRAEGILKHSGEWDLGASVSASAYRSLDATEAAFSAAKDSAASLQQSLRQSRVGNELAEEAARTATEARDITENIEKRMQELGRGEEGRAAGKASRAIAEAAEEAAGAGSERSDDAAG